MTWKLILKLPAAALALTAALAAGPVWAESGFKTLEGIEANQLTPSEMESVQGKAYNFIQTIPGVISLVEQNGYNWGHINRHGGGNFWYYLYGNQVWWFYQDGNRMYDYNSSQWVWIYG